MVTSGYFEYITKSYNLPNTPPPKKNKQKTPQKTNKTPQNTKNPRQIEALRYNRFKKMINMHGY